MDSITHRELRNSSSEVLRRVEAGESFEVTNNGRPAARIGPVGGSTLERLIADGGARPARRDIAALARIERVRLPVTTREVIDDVRGDR